MNIITSIAPIAASAATLAASPTLVLAVGLLHLAAKAVSRLIPDSKTGVLGTIRKAAKVLGVEPENRVFDSVTVASILTPPATAPKTTLQVDADGHIQGLKITNDGIATMTNVAVDTLKIGAASAAGWVLTAPETKPADNATSGAPASTSPAQSTTLSKLTSLFGKLKS